MKTLLARVWQHKSALVLILANLIPIGGVLFAGWDAFDVVYVYWLENVVIGGFNVVKLLTFGLLANPDEKTGKHSETPFGWKERLLLLLSMLFIAGFFCFHYGMFTFVHGVFVLALGQLGPGGAPGNAFNVVDFAWGRVLGDLAIPFLALVLSHGFSFVYNFLYRGEYKQIAAMDLMQGPYGRVLVMHFTVLLGGFLSLFLPGFMAVLLVILKLIMDLKYHLKEREKGAITLVKGVASVEA